MNMPSTDKGMPVPQLNSRWAGAPIAGCAGMPQLQIRIVNAVINALALICGQTHEAS
jgi:hypothetical protein